MRGHLIDKYFMPEQKMSDCRELLGLPPMKM